MNLIDNQNLLFNPMSMSIPCLNKQAYLLKPALYMNVDNQENYQPVKTTFTTTTNSSESDLTELSWLTTSMNVFNKSPNETPIPLNYERHFENENYLHTSDHIIDDLDSSFSSISSTSSSILNRKVERIDVKHESTSHIKNDIATSTVDKINFNTTKPPLTLSCLIFMSIQESKHKCLPVRDIYEWIETNFPYYKTITNGWKSSIRHNLSFSKCFKKMDRLESCKYLTQQNTKIKTNKNLHRSLPACGTCWKVNPECKAYLIHILKKSSFWLAYNKNYPNLIKLMQNSTNEDSNVVSYHHKYHYHLNKREQQQKTFDDEQKTEQCMMMYEDISSSSSSLSTDNNINTNNDDNDDDVTKAAEILISNYNNLEIEVASTLVRLKSLIETRN